VEYGGRLPWEEFSSESDAFEHAVRASGHPAYGLTSDWGGPLGYGAEFVNGEQTYLGLAYMLGYELDSPYISVATSRETGDDALGIRAIIAGIASNSPSHSIPEALGVATPLDLRMRIEGRARTGSGYRRDDVWIVRFDAPPGVVFVEAGGFDPNEVAAEHDITRIRDLEPFFQGRRDLLRRHWG
jgi:hypothetical protein